MTPEEAREISESVDINAKSLSRALQLIKWAAEQGGTCAELSYANHPEVRKRLRKMGYVVKWSWRHMDHIAVW